MSAPHRYISGSRATDLLPTAYVLETAKRAAARACAEAATGCAWADPAAAKRLLDLIPYVALAALAELCIDVRRERLARCLLLDPLDGVDELDRLKREPGWRADLVEVVVQTIGGGR